MRMRSRTVHPEFFKCVELYEAEVAYGLPLRLAFEGLWGMADRERRFEWKPRVLKLDILPYDTVDFEECLNALAEAGFIRRYEVDGKLYGLVPKLLDWQSIHKDEAKSRLPAPPDQPPEISGDLPKSQGPKERRVTKRRPRKNSTDQRNPQKSPEIPGNLDESSPTSTSTSTSTSEITAGAVHTNGNGRAPPQPAVLSWVQEAVVIHEKHIGMVGYPKLGRILKPLVDRHGWDAVKPVWEYFCEFAPYADSLARIEAGVTRNGEKPIKKLGYSTSPQAFVEHYTHWAQEAAAA